MGHDNDLSVRTRADAVSLGQGAKQEDTVKSEGSKPSSFSLPAIGNAIANFFKPGKRLKALKDDVLGPMGPNYKATQDERGHYPEARTGGTLGLLRTLFSIPVRLAIPEANEKGKITKGEVAKCIGWGIASPIVALHAWTAAVLLVPVGIVSAGVSFAAGQSTQRLVKPSPPARTLVKGGRPDDIT